MGTIEEQIKANTAKIEANNTRISQLRASGNAWIADSKDDACKQSNESKRNACLAEKDRKNRLGQDYLKEATVLESMNAQLMADNKELIKQREAEAQSMIILAQQGTTTAAVQTKANAEAEAAKAIADANSEAIITKAAADATTTTDQSKRNTMITIAVVVVVLVVAGIIISKKLKKTKK